MRLISKKKVCGSNAHEEEEKVAGSDFEKELQGLRTQLEDWGGQIAALKKARGIETSSSDGESDDDADDEAQAGPRIRTLEAKLKKAASELDAFEHCEPDQREPRRTMLEKQWASIDTALSNLQDAQKE